MPRGSRFATPCTEGKRKKRDRAGVEIRIPKSEGNPKTDGRRGAYGDSTGARTRATPKTACARSAGHGSLGLVLAPAGFGGDHGAALGIGRVQYFGHPGAGPFLPAFLTGARSVPRPQRRGLTTVLRPGTGGVPTPVLRARAAREKCRLSAWVCRHQPSPRRLHSDVRQRSVFLHPGQNQSSFEPQLVHGFTQSGESPRKLVAISELSSLDEDPVTHSRRFSVSSTRRTNRSQPSTRCTSSRKK